MVWKFLVSGHFLGRSAAAALVSDIAPIPDVFPDRKDAH